MRELATVFLRLGATSFGGPAAHVALMQRELVERRRWLDQQTFLDLYSAAQLIPGPNSTELALHIGWRRAGFAGLLVAGTCFILPAVVIVLVIARLYVTYGTLPAVAGILYGIKPVIVAIVAQALYSLGKTALKTKALMIAAALCVALSLVGVHELVLLGLVAIVFGAWSRDVRPSGVLRSVAVPTTSILLAFAKIGSVLFGSGYVLLAFLRADLVERWHWLSESQLLDAIAVGQFTPGPVFTTATFIGYLIGGYSGAMAATIGIFLPAFVFVGLTAPFLSKLRSSTRISSALDGLNAASWALMAVVGWHLGRSSLHDPWTGILAVASLAVLLAFKGGAMGLVLAGGTLGYFFAP